MSVSIKFLICLRCVLFVFFVPNIKFSHGVITPQTWIEGKWLKCEQQLQTQCCDIQKKKGRRRNKAICFHHPHTSALWTQSHLSLCCLHAADRISTRVILRIQSYQHALYISHAELLVLLHYCLLLSYLSLVGNSTGHCNDPGKTIQKWSESTFFPLPLSLPLLTTER